MTDDSVSSPIRRFVIDAAGNGIAVVTQSIIGLVAVSVFTRVFPPTEYGVYSLVLAFTVPLVPLVSEWVAQPSMRYYAQYQNDGQLASYYDSVFRLLQVMTALIVVLTLLAAAVLRFGQISLPSFGLLIAAASSLLTQSLFNVGLRILPVRLKARQYRLALILSSGASTVASFVCIWLFGKDVMWLFWGSTVAHLCLIPFVYKAAGFSKETMKLSRFMSKALPTVRRFLRYGAPFAIWFGATSLMSIVDRYPIQIFRGTEDVAIYSVSYGLVTQILMFASFPLSVAMMPILTRQWAQGRTQAVKVTISQMTDIYFILGFAVLGIIALAGESLTKVLLGPGFSTSASVLVPIAAGVVIYGAAVTGQKGIELAEQTLTLVGAMLFAVAAKFALNMGLLPHFGIEGAAFTTFVSYCVFAALIWWLSKRSVPWCIPWGHLGISALCLIGSSFIVWRMFPLLGESAVMRILGGSTLFAVVYCVAILLFRQNSLRAYGLMPVK